MTNKQISRFIREFEDARQGWIDILVKNPGSVQAAEMILSVNHKIEFLRTLYNYAEELWTRG